MTHADELRDRMHRAAREAFQIHVSNPWLPPDIAASLKEIGNQP